MGNVGEEEETLLIKLKLWVSWDIMDGEASLRRVSVKHTGFYSTLADSEKKVIILK